MHVLSTQKPNLLSTAEVANLAGVHRDTLLRWLRQKEIPEPERDRHGWRVFTEAEAQQVVRYAQRSTYDNLAEPAATYGDVEGVQRLAQLDWNFADARTSYLTHALHPYPAKFIPQIPNALIQELSSVGETVVDVFCGSGTTLVEALLLKRHAVGVDANPLACLISAAKTATVTTGDEDEISELALLTAARGEALMSGQQALFVTSGTACWRPDDPAIAFWFEPHVVDELAEVLSRCRLLSGDAAKKLALTAFSSIVVSVSRQDSDTRYVRRPKSIRPGETFRRFAVALADSLRLAKDFTAVVEPRFSCRLMNANVLDGPELPLFHLVVSSPPYPNAYSYHLYHMTRMLWLGMDQPAFKAQEIGSHRKYSSKSQKRATIDTFRSEMVHVLAWLRPHLAPRRHACFVVGDSTIAGRRYSNADIIAEAGAKSGFAQIARFERVMQETRKAFNPAIGKIKAEQIVVLQKQGE